MATLHMERTKNAKFSNVSGTLLFITLNVVGVPRSRRVWAASRYADALPLQYCLQNYFWNYRTTD